MVTQRLTKQKQIIKDLLIAQHTHLTGEQIYTMIKDQGYRIGRATVFRNLKKLVSQNEIGYIPIFDGAAFFDFQKHPHYHFKCDCCQMLFDTAIEYQKQLDTMLPDFKVQQHNLVFSGKCKTCQHKH